jgi:hypothetical protein
MTTRELLDIADQYPLLLVGASLLPPLVALILSWTHERGKLGSPVSWAYAALVYTVCVPGVFAVLLALYTVLFTRESLLDLSILVVGLPMASMGATLLLVGRAAPLEELPGFHRVWGLLLLIAITFGILFALSRTRIWVLFGGSFIWLLALGVGIFLLLKYAGSLVSGKSGKSP